MFEDVEIVENPLATPAEVWFEPWGMNLTLAPGQSFRVVAVSDRRGELEVVWDGSVFAVYAWPGSTLRVYAGDELVEDLSMKLPELPPGMSSRSFVRLLFGRPGGPVRT